VGSALSGIPKLVRHRHFNSYPSKGALPMSTRSLKVIPPNEAQSYAGLPNLTCKIPSTLTNNAYTILELRLEPGQGAGLHFHQYEDEIVLVQQGKCTFGNTIQQWELAAGSMALFPKQAQHFFRNTGSEECILMITAIPGGLDQYFAVLSEAIVQQDTKAIGEINAQYGITFVEG
jgi:quercetin dioxygenase-like cupin family protein